MILRRGARGWLAAILACYLLLAVLFALYTPAWQAPDEPAHYNYVRYVAERGGFPVLHMGDYPHAYLEQIKEAKFPATMPIDTIRYEFHQPPLYYVLAAPIYRVFAGSLLALRLFSVLIGGGIVLLAYGVAARLSRGDRLLPLAAAAFVAFLPQHLATVSQVGNDALAELLLAAVLYLLVRGVQRSWEAARGGTGGEPADRRPQVREAAFLGVLIGLILITKTTAYIAAPLAGGVLVWRWRRERTPLRRIAIETLAVFLPAALLALPWYARNAWAYGWPDILGLIRHDQIVAGQTRTAEYVAQSGWAAYWRRAIEWTFKSFWGVFGWMAVWLDTRVYFAMALFSILAIAGALARLFRRDPREPVSRPNGPALALLALTALFAFLAYAWYNVTFLQHQGRYLFTALIPISILIAAGWIAATQPGPARILAGLLALFVAGLAAWGLLGPAGLPKWPMAIAAALAVLLAVASYLPARARTLAAAAPFAAMPVICLYALFGAIVPALK